MADASKSRPAVEGVASADRALTVLSAFRKGDRARSLAALAAREAGRFLPLIEDELRVRRVAEGHP